MSAFILDRFLLGFPSSARLPNLRTTSVGSTNFLIIQPALHRKRWNSSSLATGSCAKASGEQLACTYGDNETPVAVKEGSCGSTARGCLVALALSAALIIQPALNARAEDFAERPLATPYSLIASAEARVPSSDYNNIELPPIPTTFPPLGDVALPPYEKIILPNGLRVFLVEDHELGLVEGQLLVRGGARTESPDQLGLARLTAAVQRTGGSIQHPNDELDELLERRAASIESGSSASQMSVQFSALSEDLPEVFSLFAEVVRTPAMPEEKLVLARRQLEAAILRRNDFAENVAAREMRKLLYGPESPYARTPELDTVESVATKDLLDFHKGNFRPETAVLGLWGDFQRDAAMSLVEELFGDWEGSAEVPGFLGAGELRTSEAGICSSPSQVYLIDKPGLTQGYVRMGELGTTLDDPDLFALDVLNGVLNGFGGRLFDQVRSRAGLAYSVSGGWSPSVEHRGVFVAGGETQADTVTQFIQAMAKVFTEATVVAPAQEDLTRAKDAALNSFVFNFTDNGAQLSRIMTYDLFSIPQDFVFEYRRRVQETTGLDVLRAAKKHLHPQEQCMLIVADAKLVNPPLLASGKNVVVLPLL